MSSRIGGRSGLTVDDGYGYDSVVLGTYHGVGTINHLLEVSPSGQVTLAGCLLEAVRLAAEQATARRLDRLLSAVDATGEEAGSLLAAFVRGEEGASAVYADWLEERQQYECAARVRALGDG